MKISDGHIVKFKQSYYTDTFGHCGDFIRSIKFPDDLEPSVIEQMRGKQSGESFSVFFPEFSKIVYDETLNYKVPRKKLKGVEKIEVGMVFKTGCGNTFFNGSFSTKGIVTKVEQDLITLDCNQPFIGQKNIHALIYIISINKFLEDFEPKTTIMTFT